MNGVHMNGTHMSGAHMLAEHMNGGHRNGGHRNGGHRNGGHMNGAPMNGAPMNGAHILSNNFPLEKEEENAGNLEGCAYQFIGPNIHQPGPDMTAHYQAPPGHLAINHHYHNPPPAPFFDPGTPYGLEPIGPAPNMAFIPHHFPPPPFPPGPPPIMPLDPNFRAQMQLVGIGPEPNPVEVKVDLGDGSSTDEKDAHLTQQQRRRKLQNRTAQRNFRQRKEKTAKDNLTKIARLEKQLRRSEKVERRLKAAYKEKTGEDIVVDVPEEQDPEEPEASGEGHNGDLGMLQNETSSPSVAAGNPSPAEDFSLGPLPMNFLDMSSAPVGQLQLDPLLDLDFDF